MQTNPQTLQTVVTHTTTTRTIMRTRLLLTLPLTLSHTTTTRTIMHTRLLLTLHLTLLLTPPIVLPP